MKKNIKLVTSSMLLSALLVGCGSSTTDVATTSDDDLTGYFIDSEVIGVGYKTSSGIVGTTDANGAFRYKTGDTVELHIGNLSLGEATPRYDGLLTPDTLANGDTDTKDLLLRTLQSLDVDGDTTNGIVIPTEVTYSLETINETDIANINTEEELLNLNTDLALALDTDFDGEIDVSSVDAQAHYSNSLNDWDNGLRPDNITTYGTDYGYGSGTAGTGDCNTTNSIDISTLPMSTLTPELQDAIAYMGNEERLAYDVYNNLYNYHSSNGIEINQLKNISERSEVTHVGMVQDIVRKYSLTSMDLTNVVTPVASSDVAFESMPSGEYGIPTIQGLYDILYSKGTTSQRDALEVGCMVEVTDINDLDKYITMAEISNAQDIVDSFNVLRDGSYSHYWGFDNGLKNIGVTDGCCSLGVIDGVNYCHSEYPNTGH